MNGMTPVRFVRSALASAFIGGTAGVVIKTWRRDRERTKQLLTYAATAGASGLLVGYIFASMKRRNPYTHGLSFGGNFFALTGIFLVYRDGILVNFGRSGKQLYASHSSDSHVHVLLARYPVSPMFASAVSGGLTGLVLSTIFWYGPQVLMTNSIQGIGLSVLGQFIYDKFQVWRLEKVLQYNYPELTGNVPRVEDDYQVEEDIHWSESVKQFLTKRTYSSHVNEEIRKLEIQVELLEEEERKLQSKLVQSKRE